MHAPVKEPVALSPVAQQKLPFYCSGAKRNLCGVFVPLSSAKIYADQITTTPSVAVHIRRGDYVNLGWQLPDDYYAKSLHSMAESYNGFTLFVFSDDLEWCEAHAKELGLNYADKIVYVSGNNKENSYLDMQLMSMCESMIMSNSAFCYLAALMNTRLKLYTNPTQREV